MPTVPESPRRNSNTASAGGNPVKTDPALMALMDQLDVVDSFDQFQNWRNDFLERFEFFLGEQGSQEALEAYESFRQNRMEKVVKKVERVSDYREKGDLGVDRVSVRARNAMNEVSVILIDTVKDVRGLVPPTSVDEDRAGYTKYHLGSVLVRDGFQEYERLQKCKDIMDKLRDECVQEIGDEKLLEAIRRYDDEVNRFVSIMEDLGLYKIMLKVREFESNPSERNRKPIKEVDGDTERNKRETELKEEPSRSLSVPELPFGDDDAQGNKQAEGEESLPESPMKGENKKRRSSRKDYDVKGSWGSMPMDFGSSSSLSLKLKQDLADGSGKPPSSPPNKKKQPDQVFVTPAREPRQKAVVPLDIAESSSVDVSSPVKGGVGTGADGVADEIGDVGNNDGAGTKSSGTGPSDDMISTEDVIKAAGEDDTGSVADGSVAGSVSGMSFTSETARISETDTPRTRKAKLEWKSVKSSRGKQESTPKRGSKPKTAKADKNRASKPPRPSGTKELVTKTQGSGWSLPMDEDADASSVWSRSKPPTPRSSKPKLAMDAANIATADSPIGPGVSVRRVSRPRDEQREHKPESKPEPPRDLQEEPQIDSEEKDGLRGEDSDMALQGSSSLDVSHPTEKSSEPVGEHTTTHHHHHTNTVVHHHHTNIEERHIYESPQHVKAPYEIEDDAPHDVNSGTARVIDADHRPGTEWIGTAPIIEAENEVHDISGQVGTGKVLRRSHIRMLTFCSIDDSIDPRLLGIISQCYPLVEFAVLMRQDMAGQPRYATPEYIQRLAQVQCKTGGKMNLAAHLCGTFVDEILNGDDSILARLQDMKFKRVQINATSSYGVNSIGIGKFVQPFIEIAKKYPQLEISIQANEENHPFWQGIVELGVPENVSFLYDSSMGRGQVPEKWKQASSTYSCGYAGGIGLGGRNMTKRLFNEILLNGNNQAIWVAMESSMRCTKNGKDEFDLEKCYEVIDAAHECKIHLHPSFIN